MQKYTLASEQKVINGVTLRRIYAVTDFYALKPYDEDADFDEFEYELIKKGTFGGWVESERNLSHEAFAWIADEACVYGDAVVRDGALVYGKAQVYDRATVRGSARVYDTAKVHGRADICCHARVYDNADVETGTVGDSAKIYGNAHLHGEGHIQVFHSAEIYDEAELDCHASCGILVDDEACVYGHAKVIGNIGDLSISSDARVHGNAKLSNGANVHGEAEVSGDAEILGANIDDAAVVCGDSIIPSGTCVRGNARVELTRESGKDICIQPATYLTGNAWITDQMDYLTIGPLMLDGTQPKKLVFHLTKDRKPAVTILICSGPGYPICITRDKTYYLADDLEMLERELRAIRLHYVGEEPKSLSDELVRRIVNCAEMAQGHFADRIKELTATLDG